MTAAMECAFTPVAHRGGVVEELDVEVRANDGRVATVTLMRWPCGWRVPLHLNASFSLRNALLATAKAASA